MTTTRIVELRLQAAAHPGHRSSAYINECLDEIEELQRRLDTREKNRAKREAFEAPTHQQVAAEFERLGLNGESRGLASTFLAHYESNGWKVGGVKMRSWKAACITWKKRRQEQQGATPGAGKAPAPQIARTAEPRL